MRASRPRTARSTPIRLAILAALAAGLTWGCQSSLPQDEPATESNLTAGMTKKTIRKGVTTQAEVVEVFGPPDLVTHKDDMQVWTYDKISNRIETSSGYFNVLIAGVGSKRATSSSTSTMLIIYFDSHDVVQDYRLSVVKF